eukprot:PhM_4_TR16889/c0_g1_i1/m.66053/K18726/FAF2, UBXD8; FAS-associated factor 2
MGQALVAPSSCRPLIPFAEEFAARHPSPSTVGINFLNQSFRNSLAEASRQHKFMLVYLHSGLHPNTHGFIDGVLSDPNVAAYVSEHFVLWGCDVHDAEGMKCMVELEATTFPFLCVVLRAASKDQVVLKCQGDLTPQILLDALQKCVNDNGAAFIASRADAQEAMARQQLREQQRAELEEALRIDQERERQAAETRRRAEEAAREAEEALRRQEREDAERRQREEQEEARLMEARGLALSRVVPEPEPGADGVYTVRITLLDGQFAERRFNGTDTIENVCDYVFSLDQHPMRTTEFDIVTKMPVKVLPRDEQLKSVGIPMRAVLVVKERVT